MTPVDPLLSSTPLLDFRHPSLAALIADRGWGTLPLHDRIGAIYDFVRNEIDFGYNRAHDIPASEVLDDRRSIEELPPLRRGCLELWIDGSNVGSTLDECLHRLQLTGPGSEMQCCATYLRHRRPALRQGDDQVPSSVARCMLDKFSGLC